MHNLKITEKKLQEIKKALKDPVQGFLQMQRLTEEEAKEYFPHIQVGDVLVYVYGTSVNFYEVSLLEGTRIVFQNKLVITDSKWLTESPVSSREEFRWDLKFLQHFCCVLRKDTRKFEVVKVIPRGFAYYKVKVDGNYQMTPTGLIQKFGTKELAENFVKDLVSGSKIFRGSAKVSSDDSDKTWVKIIDDVSVGVLKTIPEAVYTGVSGTSSTSLTSTLRYEPIRISTGTLNTIW